MSFTTVPELYQQSCNLLSGADAVEIDLAALDRSDSAGLALLVSWKRQARQQNKDIVLNNAPEQLRGLARLGGVEALLFPLSAAHEDHHQT